MAPGRMTQVAANGIDIACEVSGTGPAVLFVTGARTRASLWHDQVRPLTAAGLRAPPDDVRQAAALIPGARYEEVSGCGHLGPVERPEEITRLLLDFLPADDPLPRP